MLQYCLACKADFQADEEVATFQAEQATVIGRRYVIPGEEVVLHAACLGRLA